MFPVFNKSNKKYTVCRKIPGGLYYTAYLLVELLNILIINTKKYATVPYLRH